MEPNSWKRIVFRAALLAGRFVEAHSYFQEAEALWRDRQIWWDANYQLYFRAQTCYGQGDFLGAIDFVVGAVKGWHQVNAPLAVGMVLMFQACALAQIGLTRTATRLYRAGRAICISMGDLMIPSDKQWAVVGGGLLAMELTSVSEPVLDYEAAVQIAAQWTVDGMEIFIAAFINAKSLPEGRPA